MHVNHTSCILIINENAHLQDLLNLEAWMDAVAPHGALDGSIFLTGFWGPHSPVIPPGWCCRLRWATSPMAITIWYRIGPWHRTDAAGLAAEPAHRSASLLARW